MKRLILVPLALILLKVLAACSSDEEAEPEINQVAYSAMDNYFVGPQYLPAGMTKFTLTNDGQELHHQQLIAIPEGMTADQLLAEMAEGGDAPPPPGVEAAGGTSALNPGLAGSVTQNLAAGDYVMVCFVPNAEGVPRLALGMVKPITVIPSEAPLAAAPPADLSIDMVDFGFVVSTAITAGPKEISVVNKGEQDHKAFLVDLAPGATVQDFLGAFEPGAPPGPPPGRSLGGFQSIISGGGGSFNVDLGPGDYAFVCFVGDPNTGAPHFALGMLHEFSIQ